MTDFLLDTNCFMQIVRNRPDAPQVRALLQTVPVTQLFMTDFAVHSVGIAMYRFGVISDYGLFLAGIGVGRGFGIIQIENARLNLVAAACSNHGLDFDDAYQYVAAELNGFQLVSLDADFDRTPRGRITPAAALQQFMDEQRKLQQGS